MGSEKGEEEVRGSASPPRPETIECPRLLRHRNLQDLSHSNGGRTETPVGDVKVSIWTECHCGRQRQPGCNHRVTMPSVDSEDPSRPRCRRRIAGCILEHVEPAFMVKGQSDNDAEVNMHGCDDSLRRDLEDFRGAVLGGESVEVTHKEV